VSIANDTIISVQHDIVSIANKSVHTIDGQPNRSTLVRRANVVRSALARSEDNVIMWAQRYNNNMDDLSIIMSRAKTNPKKANN
jgi:TolB-like protein